MTVSDRQIEGRSEGVPASPSGARASHGAATRLRRSASPPNAKDWHDWFWKLIYAEWSVADIAEGYGLRPDIVRGILDEELLVDHEWLMTRERVAA